MLKHIIIVVGSFRKKSFNKQLAIYISELIDSKVQVEFLNFSDIPYMNQDLELSLPPEIESIKNKVSNADALWFVTPEYNGSYPGLLKNLLDWLSRPFIPNNFASGTAMKNKKVTVSGVGGRAGAKGAIEKLNILLKNIGSLVMEDYQVGISLKPESFKTDLLNLTLEDKERIKKQGECFFDFIQEG